MEVLSVTLHNFKAHRDRYFEFRPGTNAICGENGVGKTSILEAIAWVLFDHSDYTKAEIIRAGTTSAQATVTFLSNLDGQIYEVRRCTNQGYRIYDPQLQVTLIHKKREDVTRWLREHLGVAANTELNQLFAETIGIPQGTFTVDFLKRPMDRKRVFDPILKVEEYKQTYDKTRDLETFANAQVDQLEQAIATYDQQLLDWSDLKQQAADLTQALQQDQAHIEQLTQEIQTLKTDLDQLTAQAQQVQTLEQQVQRLQTQLASKQEALQSLLHRRDSAAQAVQICTQHRPSFQVYQQAQETLRYLTQQQRQRQQLLQQREQLQIQLRDRQVEQSQQQGRLETFAQMRQYLGQWQVLVPQQEQLEQRQRAGQQALQTLESSKLQAQTLNKQLTQRQHRFKVLMAAIVQLQPLEITMQQLPALETKRQDLQSKLSRVEVTGQFAAELEQLVDQIEPDCDRYRQQVRAVMPLLAKLPAPQPHRTALTQALDAGVTLNAQILETLEQRLIELADLATVATLHQQLGHIDHQIQVAQQAQLQWSTLAVKQTQAQDLEREITELQQQYQTLQDQLKQESHLQDHLSQIEQELVQLQDPKGQIRVLQQQLQQASEVQGAIAHLQQTCTDLQTQLTQFDEQLAAFAELDVQVEQQQQTQQTHQAHYQLYLRHRNEANTFRELDQSLQAASTERDQLQQQLTQTQAQYQQQSQQYDPQRLVQVTATLQATSGKQAQLRGGLEPKRSQLQTLNQQLQARREMSEQRDRARKDLTQKQCIQQFITSARRIYNQSGPRITEFYLAEISWEADRLFRELLNRSDVALEWTKDYEICVQEDGHWRSFKSLSGGEQMCAALAVRLALLKVLADVNVAFFDEPTTNMDQARRRQLAEALGHLKSFRQLFVISHDDTFESVTENIIRVERDNP